MQKEERPVPKGPHTLILEERKRLTVTGVTDVDSFAEDGMVIYTGQGQLSLRGTGLRIDRLDTETGELSVTGAVFALAYTDERPKSGAWKRLFR
ncbi:MAG: YabP/YqfC family sporulation protein [Clostridia bacterium]|nr:YabP/YqfC family sporulation protein [Clostridia bacterium]